MASSCTAYSLDKSIWATFSAVTGCLSEITLSDGRTGIVIAVTELYTEGKPQTDENRLGFDVCVLCGEDRVMLYWGEPCVASSS